MADLRVETEPAFPEIALEPTPEARAAEAKWWNDVLLWGRTHHDRLQRVCTWARELKAPLPDGYCG